jgi:hypothetical protein
VKGPDKQIQTVSAQNAAITGSGFHNRRIFSHLPVLQKLEVVQRILTVMLLQATLQVEACRLSLALLQIIRDSGLPAPAGGVPISPWCDFHPFVPKHFHDEHGRRTPLPTHLPLFF